MKNDHKMSLSNTLLLIRTKPNPPPACKHLAVQQRQQLRERHLWSEREEEEGTGGCVFCTCELLTASFRFTSLPGHESLQSGHVLLGEVVLSHHVLQRLQVTRNHQHWLHLVLALGSETRASINHVTWRAGLETLTERIGFWWRRAAANAPWWVRAAPAETRQSCILGRRAWQRLSWGGHLPQTSSVESVWKEQEQQEAVNNASSTEFHWL